MRPAQRAALPRRRKTPDWTGDHPRQGDDVSRPLNQDEE
jgi:hypothetical protein